MKRINFIYIWLIGFILLYVMVTSGETHLLPNIFQIVSGFKTLFTELEFGIHIITSIKLCLVSVFIATLVSLTVVYISPYKKMEGLSTIISRLRYLPMVGFTFYASTLFNDARHIQIFLLVFFISTYLITGLLAMIADIKGEEWDHALTLGLTKWQCIKEVIIYGRLDYVIDIVRQNMAICWMMIVAVETILYSNGGIGTLLKNSDRYTNHGTLIAIQITILLIGLSFDTILKFIRKTFFRYTF